MALSRKHDAGVRRLRYTPGRPETCVPMAVATAGVQSGMREVFGSSASVSDSGLDRPILYLGGAFASKLQARPCPTFGRPVHRRGCPLDYGPVLLLMPFGFHLAMDTLPSAVPTSPCGQRGIIPAFGYGSPHLRARGTSTLLNNALLSAQFGQA
jgi:hypothetical protein